MVEALELSRVRCILVGFDRVASKVTCLPVKPDRVQKYLSGMHYQYTLLYPASVSGPEGSTTLAMMAQSGLLPSHLMVPELCLFQMMRQSGSGMQRVESRLGSHLQAMMAQSA